MLIDFFTVETVIEIVIVIANQPYIVLALVSCYSTPMHCTVQYCTTTVLLQYYYSTTPLQRSTDKVMSREESSVIYVIYRW